jgi:aldose 1-epimerase
MRFTATTATCVDGQFFHYAYMLRSARGAVAEIRAAPGCNTVAWEVPTAGRPRDILYAPAMTELFCWPTRGGIPVLFPFPNRIRGGHFSWGGQEYQLQLNDPAQQNAIHGYTPRSAWRVLDHGADDASAWLRSEFSSAGAADERVNWPACYRLTLTIRLTESALGYEAAVENPDTRPLPFGLGYHPYFVVTPDCRVQTPARRRWVLADNLPTGDREALRPELDLREPKAIDGLNLDDVYTDFPDVVADRDGLVERGRVEYPAAGVLRVRTSPAFRELVLFIPPHRQAVCLEPYTCPTDAVNLTNRGLDVGWQVLGPGETWGGVVEYMWENE